MIQIKDVFDFESIDDLVVMMDNTEVEQIPLDRLFELEETEYDDAVCTIVFAKDIAGEINAYTLIKLEHFSDHVLSISPFIEPIHTFVEQYTELTMVLAGLILVGATIIMFRKTNRD